MCSKCVQSGLKRVVMASKMAQNGSKWCQNGPKGVREGQNGGEWARGRAKRGEKAMNSRLAHRFPCEYGLLSTLSGKGWTNIPFSGGSSPQCEALRAFSTLLGHFGVILGPFGASSAKSRICQVPQEWAPNGRSKMSKKTQNGAKTGQRG